ncbi:MAG TPA: YfhO family protein [Clostridia bacterium]
MKKRELIDLTDQGDGTGGRVMKAFRRNRYLWYAFLFPFILTYLAYLTRGIYPVANRDILTIDLYHQYAPFMSELYEKLSGFHSLLYTWNAGLGINFLALSAYYLISPFNLILLLFPRANLPEAIAFIQVLKIGLCSLTMAFYLRKKFGREGIGLALFGTFYAMSAYILAYSWNIMWLDGILMLPLVALGLEEMIAGRRFARYCIALTLTITFCYYVAYFVCLFLVIYFFVAFFSRHQALQFGLLVRKGLKFAFFSALAGGVSAVIVLPTYTALQLTSAASDTFPSAWKLSFNLFDFLTNQMMVVPLHIRDGLPNIYCGIAMLILIPLYFFSPTISIRSKIAHIFGLLVLYFSFNINALDFIWNGMHYPNQLPYRYAFVYVFLVISMGYPVFIRLKEYSPRLLLGIAMAAAAFVFLAEKLGAASADPLTIYLSVLFLAFLAAAFAYARNTKNPRELRVTVLASVMIAEILVNTFITVDLMDNTEHYSDRAGFVEDRVRLIDLMDKIENDGSGEFYRVELLDPRTVNDTILHSYRGVSIFASTTYLDTTRVMRALGLHNNGINSYRYSDSTSVLESILGLRYLVGKDVSYTRPHLESYLNENEYAVFRNPYALPIAYMAGQNMKDWQLYRDNPFEVQNQFIELAAGIKDVLVPLKTSVESQTGMSIQTSSTPSSYSYTKTGQGTCSAVLSIYVPVSQEVSFFLDANQLDFSTEVTIGGDESTRKTYDLTRPYIVDLGLLPAGTTVQVKMPFKDVPSGIIKLYSVGMDDAKYQNAMGLLAKQGLKVDHFSDTSIEGTIEVSSAGTMFTSIPYDIGWKISVDGEPTQTHALAEGLLAVDLTPGTHHIEMHYLPPRLIEGAAITGFSLILLGAVLLIAFLVGRRRPPDAPLYGDGMLLLPEWSDGEADADMELPAPEGIEPVIGTAISHGMAKQKGRTHALTSEPIRHVTLPRFSSQMPEDVVGLPPQIPRNPVDTRFLPLEGNEKTDLAKSGGHSGREDSLEHGVREDLPEHQGNDKQENGETEQDEQGIDRPL